MRRDNASFCPPPGPIMKITSLDDWFDTLRRLPCYALLQGHEVSVWTDHEENDQRLAERLADTDALILLRERTKIRRELIERLPKLRLISQRSVYPHIDVAACTEHGVLICSHLHADTPSYAAAEMTWALVLGAMCQLPQQVASMRQGRWQSGMGHTLRGKTLGISAMAASAASWRAMGAPSACACWSGDGPTRSRGQGPLSARKAGLRAIGRAGRRALTRAPKGKSRMILRSCGFFECWRSGRGSNPRPPA